MRRCRVVLGALACVTALACDQGEAERAPEPFIGHAGTGMIPFAEPAGSGGAGDTCAPVAAIPTETGLARAPTSSGPASPHFSDATLRADDPPPPISGGTLLATADGRQLLAADPDRDAVYVIDVEKRSLVRRIALSPKDEPGRVVQDSAGRIHVALRGGRSVMSFELATDSALRRSEVCDLPRGLAYEPKSDRLFVACAEGAVVQLDPSSGAAERRFELGRDLRDVIARDGRLLVTRFRTAELLEVDAASGSVISTRQPPTTSESEVVGVQDVLELEDGRVCGLSRNEERIVKATPHVAWRSFDVPGRGVAMLHQRASERNVRVETPGGYGGGGQACTLGIVRTAISIGDDASSSFDLGVPGTFVDMAVDPTGTFLATSSPSAWGTESSVAVFEMPGQGGTFPAQGCFGPFNTFGTEGQPTAVSFVSQWLLAVQEREPAGITFYDVRTPRPETRLDLAQPSRYDSGHTLFHLMTGSGMACASCHAEAGDDAHVWTFEGIGPRRTQSLRGGILGSEPFHWNGDMRDFRVLVDEVMIKRMGAPAMRRDQADALAHWIDRLPLLKASVRDPAAVERGKALFESEAVGCAKCHAGERLSNNTSADVGTGARLQVPSLRGVSFRAPLMHDGCAATLRDRFGRCGGGDKHGKTSQLSSGELDDLIAFLESL